MNLRLPAAITALLLLSACATPPGQIADSELEWSTATVPMNYQAAYRNVNNGFRKCGDLIAEGNLYSDIKEGNFDIYLPSPLGAKTPHVFGFVRVKSIDENSSRVSVGVNRTYDAPLVGKKGERRERILGWASGEAVCGA